MKSLYEPAVVALAGLEPEWPRTGLAGMGPMKYTEIRKKMQLCRNMHPKFFAAARLGILYTMRERRINDLNISHVNIYMYMPYFMSYNHDPS